MDKLRNWASAAASLGLAIWLSWEVLTNHIGDPEEGRRRTRAMKEMLYWLSDALTPYGAAALLMALGVAGAVWFGRKALQPAPAAAPAAE